MPKKPLSSPGIIDKAILSLISKNKFSEGISLLTMTISPVC